MEDQELQEANNRLMKKREEQGVTENPTRLILRDNEFLRYVPDCRHGGKIGYCESCREEKRTAIHEPTEEKTEEPIIYNGHPIGEDELPPKYRHCSLENFQGNDKLLSAIKEMISSRCSVFLTGKTGCGKTHLLVAIAKETPTKSKYDWQLATIPGTVLITAPELLLKVRASFQDGAKLSEEQVIDFYSGCDLLCLDDLGAEKTTEFAITTLYLILDRRVRDGKQTIITSNLSLEEIEQFLGARIASRISETKIVKIAMPDYRKRRQP